MIYSKYNIFSEIHDSENFFIVNLLSGNADILNRRDAEKLRDLKNGIGVMDKAFVEEAAFKGYLVDEEEERKLYLRKYLDFIDDRDKDEIQIFFVTNYSCNFACSYCYQDQYENPGMELNKEIIDAFFSYVQNEFAGRRKYITVFGGEPLLNSPKQKSLISYFLKKASDSDLEVCVVTNGYHLEEYIELLKTVKIREIQVTLDGTESVHDKRRFLKGGRGTYGTILRGIDACLLEKININLRMVIDRDNIENLPQLADVAIERGWTQSPWFKTQIGRNYELHHCQSAPGRLFDRYTLYLTLYELIKKFPQISGFYRPAYSVTQFLSDNGRLPDPLFDSCPACKTEWAFDFTGNIYSCTATVGKTDESLGTYYPEVVLNREMISKWETRDVTAITECKNCNLQLACGGGCGSIAKNRTGMICSTDCRPVKELLQLGFAAFFPEEKV
jgi:uncharacterized protein